METIRELVELPDPGPGTGARPRNAGSGRTRKDMAVIIALALLRLGRKNVALTWKELLPEITHHNGCGDAVSKRWNILVLDRDENNKVIASEENLVRCARLLASVGTATPAVAELFDCEPGCDLIEMAEALRDGNTPEAETQEQEAKA